MINDGDELKCLVEIYSGWPKGVNGNSDRDRAVIPNGILYYLESFTPKTRTIFERSTVLIGALVIERRKKLNRKIAVGSVYIDDIEARPTRSPSGFDPVFLNATYVRLFERLRNIRDDEYEIACDLTRSDCGQSRFETLGMNATMREFHAGERVVNVNLVAHDRECSYIVVVPEPR
jgi:hypothetical protein